MTSGEIGIILAIVGVGIGVLSLLATRFSGLNKQIESVENRLRGELTSIKSQIDRVETRLSGELAQVNSLTRDAEARLRGELSGIHSEIVRLREQNTMRDIDRINKLEDEMHSIQGLPKSRKRG
ncbi:MAG: hypothetical protein OXI86_02720 [Candidatus Poribacteria bacterium]|nr:hypothetical protein [Candidatus Poribacteria bacterium]